MKFMFVCAQGCLYNDMGYGTFVELTICPTQTRAKIRNCLHVCVQGKAQCAAVADCLVVLTRELGFHGTLVRCVFVDNGLTLRAATRVPSVVE